LYPKTFNPIVWTPNPDEETNSVSGRLAAWLAILGCFVLGISGVPSATASTSQAGVAGRPAMSGVTTATYKRHITKIGYHTNIPCPAGQKKYFVVTGRLATGQKFVKLRVHYLRLTTGKTVRSTNWLIYNDHKAIWYFPASRYAKVSSRLAYSYTSFDAQGGATYTGVTSKICES